MNIFDKPFDEGTIAKLEIIEKYLESWLPTFVMVDYHRPIQVFDLFAGIGYDKNSTPGSPIRILTTIHKHKDNIISKSKRISLFFNDLDTNKIEQLKQSVKSKVNELDIAHIVNIKFTSNSFKECLNLYDSELRNGCNFIFIDQNGFKEVDEKVFQYLIEKDTTEFIFFVSSSYLHRFAETKEVQNIHPNFDYQKIKNTKREQIHNVLCDEFKKYIPSSIRNTNYSVIPFSIMKKEKQNIYGLIFVSKHIRGADKFLDVVWEMSPINGNANFV